MNKVGAFSLAGAGLLLMVPAVGLGATPVTVTTCGQTIPARAVAVLANDIDCVGHVGPGVILQADTKLELNGFSIIGDPAQSDTDGVSCVESCRIKGPGEIRGFTRDGVISPEKITLEDVTLSNHGHDGASATHIAADGCVVRDNSNYGLYGRASVNASFSEFAGNPVGISVWPVDDESVRATVANCTFTDDGGVESTDSAVFIDSVMTGDGGVWGRHVTVSGSQITDSSDIAVYSQYVSGSVRVVDSTISRNSGGIYAEWSEPTDHGGQMPHGAVSVSGSELNDNAGCAISAYKSAKVANSTITGNGCGIDSTRVTVTSSTVSQNLDGGAVASTWGVLLGYKHIAGKLRVVDSTIADNGCFGVSGHGTYENFPRDIPGVKVSVRGSTISGNGTAPPPAATGCYDITSGDVPKVKDTICATSYSESTESDWGICSLDM